MIVCWLFSFSMEGIDMAEALVSVDELAELLGVHKSWIYARTRTGEIPFYRLGKYRRFSLSEVQSWLESERQTGQ